ncbi:MAG: hypothetical protein JXR51_06140 [Bacteroidales bacterium]|nr:hypothetical protein [Bacteroidales bacterium]MBN2756741.1 hypothetical protein [Bacteroidales bacterium]
MYKLKSEIIEKIQHYHKQVYELYLSLYKKSEDPKVKEMLSQLYQQEIFREKYLEKHKKVAKALNSWLFYPSNKIQNNISECLSRLKIKKSNLTVNDVAEIELHFDNCLIQLYEALSSEEGNNGNVTNIFYYMINKTKLEDKNLQEKLAELLI